MWQKKQETATLNNVQRAELEVVLQLFYAQNFLDLISIYNIAPGGGPIVGRVIRLIFLVILFVTRMNSSP